MHIVFISNEYPLWASGGKGTFIQTFARALVNAGHRATVLGIGIATKKQVFGDQGVFIIRLKRPLLPKGKYIENSMRINKELRNIHKESGIDIVETSELDCAYLPKQTPFKKVIRLHGGHHFFAEAEKRTIDPIKGKREKKSFKNADAFIAVSRYVKIHTEKYLSYNDKPIQTIYNLLDTAVDIPITSIKKNHILFAGTVCEKKGVNQLIEAFVMLRTVYPEKKLDIYGRDWKFPDGSSYIKMLQSKYKNKLENVTFYGSISREMLYKEYAASLFCIFPSHMETQGLVTLEAMLLEKLVIFSKYGPGPETIDHMKNGLLCDVYNPQEIADKMQWIIEHTDEASKMGKLARKQVLKKYDKKLILKENLTFYNELMNDL